MKKAIVIPPEPSMTSFIVNIWGYQDAAVQYTNSDQHEIIFLIDNQDYNRVRRLSIKNKKYLSVFISLKNLVDIGKIEIHDYDELYGPTHRDNYVKKIEDRIDQISDPRVDELSAQLHGGWMRSTRSERLLDIREAIGEDRAELEASKIGDKKKLERMENSSASRADTYDYIKKLLKRLAVAFVVANKINQHPDYQDIEIVGVAARPGGIEKLKNRVILPNELFAHDMNAVDSLFTPSTSYQRHERSVSSTINALAEDLTNQEPIGREIVPGLEFIHNFDLNHINEEVNTTDTEDLKKHAIEAKDAIEIFPPSGPEIQYMAEKAREGILNKIPTPNITPGIVGGQSGIPASALMKDIRNYANSLQLAHRVRELSESGEYRQTGLLVAATTLADPIYRYKKHERLYDWFNTLLGRFNIDSPSKADRRWYNTQRTMTSEYIYTGRWYE